MEKPNTSPFDEWLNDLEEFLLTRLVVLTIPIAIVAGVSGCGGAKILQESVVVRDTVVVTKERVLHDTLIVQKDTILYQDRVRVEVKGTLGKGVVITAECPSDTIRVQTIRVVNQAIQKRGISWEGLLGWVIAILCILVILRTVLQKLL
jgi:hypothetical protein